MTDMTTGSIVERSSAAHPGQGGMSAGGPRSDGDRAAPHASAATRPGWRWSRRRIGLVAGGVVAVVLLVLAFRPQPLVVQTAEVARGPMEVVVNTDGTTRMSDVYRVAAPVAGRLSRITVRPDDPVARGQVLARIYPPPMDAAMAEEATARAAAAQARLVEARGRLETAAGGAEMAARHAGRVAEVFAAGGLPRETVERARLQAQAAQEELAAARGYVAAAEQELAASRASLPAASGRPTDVRAPSPGRVLRVPDPSERVVAAGTPLVEVGDAGRLEIVADVLSTDAVRIRPGAPVRVHSWGGDGLLSAAVRTVEPSAFTRISALGVEEQRVNVIADLDATPPQLGDGFRVELRIVTWADVDVVRVPTAALFRRGDGWSVFVVENGRAVRREVRIGARGTEEAQVLGGLSPGDRVVMFPADQLRDGARVRER
jgi:HlyD family secretion protein